MHRKGTGLTCAPCLAQGQDELQCAARTLWCRRSSSPRQERGACSPLPLPSLTYRKRTKEENGQFVVCLTLPKICWQSPDTGQGRHLDTSSLGLQVSLTEAAAWWNLYHSLAWARPGRHGLSCLPRASEPGTLSGRDGTAQSAHTRWGRSTKSASHGVSRVPHEGAGSKGRRHAHPSCRFCPRMGSRGCGWRPVSVQETPAWDRSLLPKALCLVPDLPAPPLLPVPR